MKCLAILQGSLCLFVPQFNSDRGGDSRASYLGEACISCVFVWQRWWSAPADGTVGGPSYQWHTVHVTVLIIPRQTWHAWKCSGLMVKCWLVQPCSERGSWKQTATWASPGALSHLLLQLLALQMVRCDLVSVQLMGSFGKKMSSES